MSTQIELAEVDLPAERELLDTPPPNTVLGEPPREFWEMTLGDAIQIALSNSQVIRDLGGRVAKVPAATPSTYDIALQQTDPTSGPEAALSAFDGQFSSSIFWEKNDRQFNNILFGGGTAVLMQNFARFQAQISKQTAAGTQFAVRNETLYDGSNIPFPLKLQNQAYHTVFEAEARQPFLQGFGIGFNRIAGPRARPGVYNGVLLGRINTDITLADFEAAVCDFLLEVERTYWRLYLAYRELDAKIAARDAALETWRDVQRRFQAGAKDEEQEALAREQYYLFEAQVIDALNGSAGGAAGMAIPGGLYDSERRLRWLLGLPASSERFIRPADEPSTALVKFDWHGSVDEALWRRVELRRQQWIIKRRELELAAAKNFRKLRVDGVAGYRWRGLGHDLLGNSDLPRGSAFGELFSGDHQEWTLGIQLDTPIGNRIGHTAVRHAELQLARERAVYGEQQRQIVDELSTAFAEADRAHALVRAYYNRRDAAWRQLIEICKKYQKGLVPLEFLINAQSRAAQADIAYYRSLIDYDLATTQVHFARGSLLDHYQVRLAEGPWSEEAHLSAAKEARRFRPSLLNYKLAIPGPISRGEYPQMPASVDERPRSLIRAEDVGMPADVKAGPLADARQPSGETPPQPAPLPSAGFDLPSGSAK